jgi:hypothetical protein
MAATLTEPLFSSLGAASPILRAQDKLKESPGAAQ